MLVRADERYDETEMLRAQIRQLRAERDEARAWARGYEHRMFLFNTDDPPAWLLEPITLTDAD